MKLADVPAGQMVVTGAGLKARVLAHETTGTYVLAVHRREVPFGGQLVKHTESRGEVWSNGTDVEPVGQLVLGL